MPKRRTSDKVSAKKTSNKASEQKTLDRMLYGAATVGGRNQIVIPKKACDECGIKPRDVVLVFAHPPTKGLLICKADALEHIVREMKSALRSTRKESTSAKARSAGRGRGQE